MNYTHLKAVSLVAAALLTIGLTVAGMTRFAPKPNEKLLIIGDSIAAGLHENAVGKTQLAELREHYIVYSQGSYGATTDGVLWILEKIGTDVDHVWLFVGYNDRTYHGKSDGDVTAGVDKIRAVFDPGVDFTFTDTLTDLKNYPLSHKPDGIHPNGAGYEVLVRGYLEGRLKHGD